MSDPHIYIYGCIDTFVSEWLKAEQMLCPKASPVLLSLLNTSFNGSHFADELTREVHL